MIMKHTKGWLIFWILFQSLICLGFISVGIYWGIFNKIILAGFYFFVFAGIFLVGAIKDICALIRNDWIEEDAINELYKEEVEKRKVEMKREFAIKELKRLQKMR